MKAILPFLLIYLFHISFNTSAQNLVPNPGFEITHHVPDKEGNSINRSKGWIAPKYSSDYYHKDAIGRHAGTPRNIFGRQKPHSGKAYAGICTRTNFLEYVETKLNDTLIKDQDYLVEFYISRAERSLGCVKEFGVLFTNRTRWGIVERGISAKPQVIFYNRRGFKSKRKWMKLSAVYTAEGNESVLILGHFNYDPKDDKRRMLCHYYIDDVSVTPIKKTENKKDSIETPKTEDPLPETFLPKFGEAITLKNIFFKTNKSELLSESFSELDKLVGYLNEIADLSIEISGHTDNTGNEEQNKRLSELRAKAVADYLEQNGIDTSRVTYLGYGSSNPITTNETDEGKKQNRRVEFVLNKN